MEVSGKKENKHQVQISSSGSSQSCKVCQPCKADGESLEADGFCQNCQEYLCKTCIKYHRKVTVSKHHTILDKATMPKNVEPQIVKRLCTETCEKHKLKIIKYFCSDHDTVGCGNCMVIDHKACHVEFIPDIADEFINGEAYKAILDRLEKLQTKVDSKIMATGTGRETCA
ncbi:transcription intermediary factor 1-alpha-like [Ruditapes philippinarum]|uniref:transcription intermediary factor 1-alpha-like n=1 Tax=Ruditapes philippinarum TaxID=129788 RepID=UPI00295A8583|nr:transcription intermediary factor 1-alpha-like [Ruditapes philippinarum]